MKFRQKETDPGSTPEQSGAIQSRIDEINSELEGIAQALDELFRRKQLDQVHGGEYDIQTSFLGQAQVNLMNERKVLLKRIDEIQRKLARNALNS